MGVAADLGITSPRVSALARVNQRFASSTLGAGILSRTMPALDALTLKLTRGRTTYTEGVAALPTIYLTTRGAKTGEPRTVPLLAVVTGGDLAVIGSNWGRARHPGWVHNLLADPHATVAWHDRHVEVVAREASGSDADRIWAAARALYRGFRTYPARTQGRTIRVFLLTTPTGQS
jgi:deazaflavin-dependent oxidoreductase (nitroreductase family)